MTAGPAPAGASPGPPGASPGPPGASSGPLGLDPLLLSILACPDTHHTPLTVDEAAAELVCPTCSRAFPVRDGIPVLLLDEARRRGPGPEEEA